MKLRLKTTLCFALLSLASVAVAQPAVNLTTPDDPIKVGDTFSVDVFVSGVDLATDGDLVAWGLIVDPLADLTLIEFTGATIEDPYDDFSDPEVHGDVGGLLPFSATTGLSIPLATLTFKANQVGSQTLFVEGVLDGFHGLYFGNFTEYAISETWLFTIDASPVPEPGTFAAFAGVGALMWAGCRRRRRGVPQA